MEEYWRCPYLYGGLRMAESGDLVNHFAHLHPEEEEKMHWLVQAKVDAPLCLVEAAESEYQLV